VETTQKHFWLIFNNCLKLEKSLPCSFCHINSTKNLKARAELGRRCLGEAREHDGEDGGGRYF
jgi:hypothetical protein